MQGDAGVIELLNDVLTAELTAINQYFVDAKMLENWGYRRLANHMREESIDEMKDADKLIERILYLKGTRTSNDSARSASASLRRRSCRLLSTSSEKP